MVLAGRPPRAAVARSLRAPGRPSGLPARRSRQGGLQWQGRWTAAVPVQGMRREFQRADRYTLGKTQRDMAQYGCALLVCGLSLGEMAGRFRTPRFLEYLGETSYSLYLIHLPVVTVVAQLWLHFHLREWLPDSGAYISMVIVALILSCAFFELVEKPIIAFGRRRRET